MSTTTTAAAAVSANPNKRTRGGESPPSQPSPKLKSKAKNENKTLHDKNMITKPAVEAALKGASYIAYNIARYKITAARLEVDKIKAEEARLIAQMSLEQEKSKVLALEVEKMKLAQVRLIYALTKTTEDSLLVMTFTDGSTKSPFARARQQRHHMTAPLPDIQNELSFLPMPDQSHTVLTSSSFMP